MKFHFTLMQYNGEVSERKSLTTEKICSNAVTSRIVTGFTMMMEQNLPKFFGEEIVFEQLRIFDDERGLLEWRQPDPFSAMAAFIIAERMKFTWFYFTGLDAIHDATAVKATEDCIDSFAKMANPNHVNTSLKALSDRPMALCIPWPPSASDIEQRVVGNYAMCLAAAYFEKMADWQRRGQAFLTELRKRERLPGFGWSTN